MNRRGFTLFEIILTTTLIVVLMLVVAPSIQLFWQDVMQTQKDFETHTSMTYILNQFREDVRQCDSFQVETTDDGSMVRLTIADKTSQYRFGKEKAEYDCHSASDPNCKWELPYAQFQVHPWPGIENPQAIAIQTSIQRVVVGKNVVRFQNSYLLFPRSEARIKP
jgi:prepilin-type N-terminal cleavage/methylation domain-containing protein